MPQRRFAHFDRYLVVSIAAEGNEGNAGLRKQVAFDFLGGATQPKLADIADDSQGDYATGRVCGDDDRFLGIVGRKIAESINRRLDIILDELTVGEVARLDDHNADILGRHRTHAFHAVYAKHRLFDPTCDALLDLRRRGSRKRYRHGDGAWRDGRENLRRQARRRDGAADEEYHHQQVRSHGVLDEPHDDAAIRVAIGSGHGGSSWSGLRRCLRTRAHLCDEC